MLEHIEHVQKSNQTLRSPKTNLPMGKILLDAVTAKNVIETLVDNGAFGEAMTVDKQDCGFVGPPFLRALPIDTADLVLEMVEEKWVPRYG